MVLRIGPFVWDPAPPQAVAPQVEAKADEAKPVVVPVVKREINEFYTIASEFIGKDIAAFTEKYPLISTISILAFGFFGLINVLSLFSPTSILTGIFFGTLSVSLARSVWNIHGTGIFGKVWDSFRTSFINSTPPPKAEEAASATPAVQPAVQQPAPAK